MVKTEPAYVGLTPILLEIADDLASVQPALKASTTQLRQTLFLDLGVRFPEVVIRLCPELEDGLYRISLNEVPMGSAVIRPGMLLVNQTAERLRAKELDCVHAVNPATQRPSAWVSKALLPTLEDQSLEVTSPSQLVAQHLGEVLRRHARTFVKIQLVQDMVDALATEAPATVRAIVPNVLSLLQLTELLGRLVEEDISIRDLPAILQTVGERWHPALGLLRLTEDVRASMREYISNRFARNGKTVVIYLLDPKIEESIRKAIVPEADGTTHLALEPEIAQEIVHAVREEVGLLPATQHRPVILTTVDIRRYVRKLLEYEFSPPFPVLSFQDLAPEVNIQPVARISIV
jgi:type III secretion protein V